MSNDDLPLRSNRLQIKPTYTSPDVALEDFNDIRDPTISQAFDEAVWGVTPDAKMAKRVIRYSNGIASRDDNPSFFGGNLMGVDRIIFYDTDRDRWFDDVLEIDEEYLKDCIEKVPSIGKDWKVTGDVYNLSVVWYVHKCMSTLNMRDPIIHKSAIEALVMLQFKLMTSLYSHWFEKLVDKEAAQAVYSQLSMKFAIKQYGTWGEVLRQRAESFIDRKSVHYDGFNDFSPDDEIIYILSDISTRIRKSLKDHYKVLERVRNDNARIETRSATAMVDGEMIIRDTTNVYTTARNYLLDVSGNESSFIKRELVEVILDIMSTTSRQSLVDVLTAMAREQSTKERQNIEEIIDMTLQHAFNYISTERIRFNDIGGILWKMKSLYTAARSSDKTILELRERLEKYAKKHTTLRADTAIASVRTSTMLYLLLRALSANIYS